LKFGTAGGAAENSAAIDIGGGGDAGGGVSGEAAEAEYRNNYVPDPISGLVDTYRANPSFNQSTYASINPTTLAENGSNRTGQKSITSTNGNALTILAEVRVTLALSAELQTALNNGRVAALKVTLYYTSYSNFSGKEGEFTHQVNGYFSKEGGGDEDLFSIKERTNAKQLPQSDLVGRKVEQSVEIVNFEELIDVDFFNVVVFTWAWAWNSTVYLAASVEDIQIDFTYKTPEISINAQNGGSVTASSIASMNVNAAVISGTEAAELDVTAAANSGYYFLKWTVGVGEVIDAWGAKPKLKYAFYNTSTAISLTAHMRVIPNISIDTYTYNSGLSGPDKVSAEGIAGNLVLVHRYTGISGTVYDETEKPKFAGNYNYTAAMYRGANVSATGSGGTVVWTKSADFTVNKAAASVTVSGQGKTYDGTNNAAGKYTLALSGYFLASGQSESKVPEGAFNVNSAAYSSKDVGTRTISVTLSPVPGTYTEKNFSFANLTVSSGNVSISKKNVSFGVAAEDKTYDGTNSAEGKYTLTFNGYVDTDGEPAQPNGQYTVSSAAYSSKDAGSRTVSVSISVNEGADLSKNFNVPQLVAVSGDVKINKAAASFSVAPAGNGKVYDGAAAAAPEGYTITFEGYFTGSGASQPNGQYTVTSAAYSSKDAGERTIGVTISVKANSDLHTNFQIANLSAESAEKGVISKASLRAQPKINTATKVYDGTRDAEGEVTFTGFAAGESFVPGEDYTVSTKYEEFTALSNNMTVRLTLSIAENEKTNNYAVNNADYEAKAAMTKRTLGAALTVDSKEYDGTAEIKGYRLTYEGLVVHYTDTELPELAEGSDCTLTAIAFKDADAGQKTVNARFDLLSSFKYSAFYTVVSSYNYAALSATAEIYKKVLTETDAVEAEYGEVFVPNVFADGVERQEGVRDRVSGGISFAALSEAVGRGEYPVGEYTVTGRFSPTGEWAKNYAAADIAVSLRVVPRAVSLVTESANVRYDGEEHSGILTVRVETGMNDGVDFNEYLEIKSILRADAGIIAYRGTAEAFGDVIFADTYTVYYGITEEGETALRNYVLTNAGTSTGKITVEKAKIGFVTKRTEDKLIIFNAAGYGVKFVLDDGEITEGEEGQLIFEANKYRDYKIKAVMTGEDAFNYEAAVADSKAYANLVTVILINAGEAAGVIAVGFLIYYIIAASRKAKRAAKG
jgi:hypothetical protein